MNPSQTLTTGQEVQRAGPDARTNERASQVIDRAIGIQTASSTMSAVEFLKSHHIAAGTITRVLFDQAQRRATE